jgi:hypothetical protein
MAGRNMLRPYKGTRVSHRRVRRKPRIVVSVGLREVNDGSESLHFR